MLLGFLFAIACGVTGLVAANGVRTRRRRPLPLPLPGGPPEDRAEAVRRIVKHLVRRRVAELTEGDASVVVGRAVAIANAPMLADPISGKICLGYHVQVRTGDIWSLPLYEDARCVDFDLVDASGRIRVRTAGIELAITRTIERALVPARTLPWLAQRTRRRVTPVVELQVGVLVADAELLVCGVPARELTPTDYRDGAISVELVSTPTFPLVASPDADLFKLSRRPIDPAELR